MNALPEQDYPDLRLTEITKDKIALYLESEIDNSMRARADAEAVWKQIELLYEQVDVPEKKDYPFEGAATFAVQLIATYTEQLHARIHGTIYEPKLPYSCEPTRQDLYKFAKSVAKWLAWSAEHELNEEEVDYGAFMELIKLGLMVEKVVYTREDRKIWSWNESLRKWEPRIERMKDNPEYIHVSIGDYFWQMHARTIQESEWEAHRLRMSWNEVKARANDGRFDKSAADYIRNWWESQRTDMEQVTDDQAGVEPNPMVEFEFFEVYFRYPIDISEEEMPIDETQNVQTSVGSVPTALRVILHKDARKMMTIKYNTFPLGLTPFEVCPYVGRSQSVVSIGVGHMAMAPQIEITAMHQQRIDAGTVRNSSGYKYKADSRVPSSLPLRPGGGVPVDEMEDFEPFAIGIGGDSTIDAEQQALNILQERIGIRDLALDEAAMAKAPATTTMALLAEKGRRLDNVLRNIRRFKKRLKLKAMLLYKAYYPKDKLLDVLGPEDGANVVQVLSLSEQTIWDSVGISITATTSATSREMSRQNDIQLMNALIGYQDKYAQYIAAAANPQVAPALRVMALKMANGLSVFMEELLEGFNKHNSREYLLDTAEFAQLIQQAPPPAPASQPGGSPEAAAPVQDGGVEAPSANGSQAGAPAGAGAGA